MPRIAALFAAFFAVVLALPCRAQASREGPPPIFTALSYEEAVAKTKGTELVLVVKATASWCGPCKLMDKTTWRDEKVVEWFKANGIALQFDVDEKKELANSLAIQAMPTMVAFKDGKEFDRIVGYKPGPELLAWCAGVKKGEKSIIAVEKRVQRTFEGSEDEVLARYELADQLLETGDYERAAVEYEWVWRNGRDTALSGVRTSFMASDIKRLIKVHPAARERFLGLRDPLTKQLAETKIDRDDFDDWIVLNEILGEEAKSLAWFDKLKQDERYLPLIRSVGFRLKDLLENEGRWSDIALLHPEPIEELRRDIEMRGIEMREMSRELQLDAERERQLQEMQTARFRYNTGSLYACLLAADRADEAADVRELALETDDSAAMRIALVRRAVDAKQARDELVKLLDEAEAKDPKAARDVKSARKQLTKALEARRAAESRPAAEQR